MIPLLVVPALLLLSGCGHGRGRAREAAYVSGPQGILRDRVAAVFTQTGTVKNGERVEILDRDRRFARVRTAGGAEGWIEQRYLATQEVYDGFQKLAQEAQDDSVQATGGTRNETNLHLEPGRDTDHLYQVNQGAKVSILKRTAVEKSLPGLPPHPVRPTGKATPPIAPAMEDWWLVRDPEGHVGWVLGRMIDVDVPLEIAEYAEGQRIVASFMLDQVEDGDKKVPQYLVLLTEPKDGMPFDYNQIRVFTWNVRRHRYETAYREHNLNGVLPVTVSQESFDKEGTLPVFVLRLKDDDGNVVERKYKLNTPIVRRVLAPGEAPPKPARRRTHRS
jgi:hypothetical protein